MSPAPHSPHAPHSPLTFRSVPLDRELSPYTGWTREHWAALGDDLLRAVRPFASPRHALITLPGRTGGYGTAVDGLEGFSRTFMLAGFRLAGEGGADPLGLAERYAEGFDAGTDPRSPERWMRPDEHGQAKVEAAALALTLDMTRPWIWDRMSSATQERIVTYLATVIGGDYPQTNWVWFRIVVETFLRKVGGPFSLEDLESDLDVHDTFVREGGWYCDGVERNYDHYAGWALHLYPVLWAAMIGDDPLATARVPRYQAHLEEYLGQAAQLVGADGAPLFQGRSLVYRFAAAAPFWAGALSGTDALSPGEIRRAASGIVKHFADHGAPDESGLLTLGWHHEWDRLAQRYSGTGSPYWASKGLLGLALPADHPVWTATEEPLPVERGDVLAVAPAPGWLVTGTRADGIVRVVNHGTDHARAGDEVSDSPIYARLGYSTATAPVMSEAGWVDPVDQSATLAGPDGRLSHRAGFELLSTGTLAGADGVPCAAYGFSRSRAHWVAMAADLPDHGSGRTGEVTRGARLTTGSVVRGAWEVRFVRVEADDNDREGGGADAIAQRVPVGVLRVAGWPVVAATGLVSEVLDVSGLTRSGTRVDHDASPLGEQTTTPWLSTPTAAETGRWYVALVRLTGAPVEDQERSDVPQVRLEGNSAHVLWGPGLGCDVALPEAV